VPFLPAAGARAMLAAFDSLGLDAEALRTAAGIPASALRAPDAVLPEAAFARLWEAASRAVGREELPTEAGLAVPFGAFGALDYIAGSSPDVATAFAALADHFRAVASGFGLEVEEVEGGGEVRIVHSRSLALRDVSDEFTIAVLVGRFRSRPSLPFRPEAIRLTRPAPPGPTRHERLLGAPVVFGCSLSALRVPASSWRAPLPSADPALQRTLRELSARLDPGEGAAAVEQAVRARLRELLPEGRAGAAAVSRSLGMSERTLQRRLREAGRSFGEVVDRFREAEAERLLASGGPPLSEVALRLGFSDQSAFSRAFRRWKGTPPSAWPGPAAAPAKPARRARRSTGRRRRRRS